MIVNKNSIYMDNIIVTTDSDKCTISSDSGFRMMSSPVEGAIYADLLSELWTQSITGADVTKTNLLATTSVWGDAASGWKSWNGYSSGLISGLIAPFQGFWVNASGGTGWVTIETGDIVRSSGAFYRTLDNDSTRSLTFTLESSIYTDQTFMSFKYNGKAGLDKAH